MNTTSGTLDFEMKRYDKTRIPAHVWAMLLIGVVGAILIYATRN